MDVKELLQQKLKEIGADGLYNDFYECGCGLDDMCPCDEVKLDCVPARKCECKKCEIHSECEAECKDDGECFRQIEDIKNG